MSAADYPYFAAPPLGLAHRGGASFPPNVGVENTLAAFERAVELGYRYLETDVHATSDGVVVAFHDERLDRLTDRTGWIAQAPWNEVRAARIGGREPIPTLEELLEALPDTRLNIDLKAPGAVEPTWRLIEQYAAHDRVCVGSFSPRRLAAFRRLAAGRVATATGPVGTAALRFQPGWLSHLVHTPGQVLQIPVVQEVAGRRVEVLTPALVAQAHRLGLQVHAWTIDDPHEMHRLLDLGVDGIVSDRIDLLREVLLERGAWPQ